MRKIIQVECPFCNKKWTVSDEQAAASFEDYLSHGIRHGYLYEVGQKAWYYGHKEVEILEVQIGKCVKFKDGTYAHPLKYKVLFVASNHKTVVSWRVLLPLCTTTLERVQRGKRHIAVDWRNYWTIYPEGVDFH
jgi:hypothetical protein